MADDPRFSQPIEDQRNKANPSAKDAHKDATHLQPADRIRIAMSKMPDHLKAKAEERVRQADTLAKQRKKKEIDDTRELRDKRLTDTEYRRRSPANPHIPEYIKGANGRTYPVTAADKREITRRVQAQLHVDDVAKADKIDYQVQTRLANQLEFLAEPEKSREAKQFRAAASKHLGQFKGAAAAKQRGLGD